MTPENKTILPDEIKKWIECEAHEASFRRLNADKPMYLEIENQIKISLENLYQHLSGRVAELEKELANLSNHNRDIIKDLKAQREQLIEKDIEINRLITIIEKGN